MQDSVASWTAQEFRGIFQWRELFHVLSERHRSPNYCGEACGIFWSGLRPIPFGIGDVSGRFIDCLQKQYTIYPPFFAWRLNSRRIAMFVLGGVRSLPVVVQGYTVWRVQVAPSVEKCVCREMHLYT